MIFASIPFPCATDSISQDHQIGKNFSFAATVPTGWGTQPALSKPSFYISYRLNQLKSPTPCPYLDYGTSVHFTSPSVWQRLAQASVPNSIPPEGFQAMVGSLFSPQPITFTQNDFYFTLAIPILDPCGGLCRPLPNQ